MKQVLVFKVSPGSVQPLVGGVDGQTVWPVTIPGAPWLVALAVECEQSFPAGEP